MSAFDPTHGDFAARGLAPPVALRVGLLVLSGLLLLGGLWLLAAAILSPQGLAFPPNKERAAAAQRGTALLAARLGVIRGDLFARAAYADAAAIGIDGGPALSGAASAADIEAARGAAETALRLAPVDGSAWLVLAALPEAAGGEAKKLTALQLSYLTAPNDPELARPRIVEALAARGAIDKDLQALMKADLREIVLRQPRQKPAILAAYRAASPQNRQIFEALADVIDADFGHALRADPAK